MYSFEPGAVFLAVDDNLRHWESPEAAGRNRSSLSKYRVWLSLSDDIIETSKGESTHDKITSLYTGDIWLYQQNILQTVFLLLRLAICNFDMC